MAVQVEIVTVDYDWMTIRVEAMAIRVLVKEVEMARDMANLVRLKEMEMVRDVAASSAMDDLYFWVFAAVDALQTPRGLKVKQCFA